VNDHAAARKERRKRSAAQNRKLWPMLEEISLQTDWHGEILDPEDWKIMFLAALSREKNMEMRIVPGINGGLVNLGRSSSALFSDQFSDLIELIYAFGSERGVVFKDDQRPPIEAYESSMK
jgi:hypothetical protein